MFARKRTSRNERIPLISASPATQSPEEFIHATALTLVKLRPGGITSKLGVKLRQWVKNEIPDQTFAAEPVTAGSGYRMFIWRDQEGSKLLLENLPGKGNSVSPEITTAQAIHTQTENAGLKDIPTTIIIHTPDSPEPQRRAKKLIGDYIRSFLQSETPIVGFSYFLQVTESLPLDNNEVAIKFSATRVFTPPAKSPMSFTHPLAIDQGGLVISPFIDLLKIDRRAAVVNLVLENTPAAKEIMRQYRSRGPKAPYDAMLFQSILALHLLHKSGWTYKELDKGVLTNCAPFYAEEDENTLVSIATHVYDQDRVTEMLKVYGLDNFEHLSIQAYSLSNKGDKLIEGEPNPYYMFEAPHWGMYGNGWTALTSALKKLPSLGSLGLMLTTYRATRTNKPGEVMEAGTLKQLAPETHVTLGTKVMKTGQYHFTSTAITYNGHWGRVFEVGGVLAITGYSGVYINPFGKQSFIDGGEILYPPGVLTTYEGMNPTGYQSSEGTLPVFHLREVKLRETGQRIIEDSAFEIILDKDPHLDVQKMNIIQIIVEHYGPGLLDKARKATGIDGPILYLTLDELQTLGRKLSQLA